MTKLVNPSKSTEQAMPELSLSELGAAGGEQADTLARIVNDETDEKFTPLQTTKSDSNVTQDGSFHSSQYTGADFSVSLSAISGEFRQQGDTPHDTDDVTLR